MFLNKIGNIFCVPDTKFASATNVARAGKRGNICFGNNVSETMCSRLPGPLGTAVTDLNLPRRKMHQFTNPTLFRDHRLMSQLSFVKHVLDIFNINACFH